MKTIILDGRVGTAGTEVKVTKAGKQYARFSLANNTYTNGEEKTEWFEIISYDPTFIEKRAQYLNKGSYVIVTGNIRTEVKVGQDNKMYINHYVTASNIDTPRLGGKSDNATQDNATTSTPVVSTFTGGTKSEMVAQVTAQPSEGVIVLGAPSQVAVATVGAGSVDDSDLPF